MPARYGGGTPAPKLRCLPSARPIYGRGVKTELELRQLRVFAAVVDAGTHTRAAKALGLSQSTVSETLSALERAVGVELFRKTKGAPALTPAGTVLLEYARRMFALGSELVGAL